MESRLYINVCRVIFGTDIVPFSTIVNFLSLLVPLAVNTNSVKVDRCESLREAKVRVGDI